MTRSMTAFATVQRDILGGLYVWEIRCVNHRFLDISFRVPDSLRSIESDARACVSRFIRRGRVELSLSHKKSGVSGGRMAFHYPRVEALLEAANQVRSLSREPLTGFSPLDVLAWPGVMEDSGAVDASSLSASLVELLEATLGRVVEVRAQEGQQLARLVSERCLQVSDWASRARTRLPEALSGLRESTRARVQELTGQVDPARFEQEIVYLAQRLDVSEELDRLDAHVTEVLRNLELNEPTGRRLDFLMQELHREANTLGSKSADIEMTRASVEMKVLIEQMREQVQNIE